MQNRSPSPHIANDPNRGLDLPDALGVVGGVLCILTISVVAFTGHGKSTEQALYLFLFGVVPLLAVGIVSWMLPRLSLAAPVMVGKIFIAMALLLSSALVIAQMPHLKSWPATLVTSIAVAGAVIFAALFGFTSRRPAALVRAGLFADTMLVAGLAIVLVLFSPLDPKLPFASTMVGYMRDTPNFGVWILGGLAYAALCMLVGAWEVRSARSRAARSVAALALALALALVLGLYDDGHWVDIGHYSPLIGPALYSRMEGAPMADVYCQYGLIPWLLVRASFAVLPPTAGTTAIIVRVTNVAFLMTFVLIAFSVTRRKTRAMLLMMPVLLAGISFHAGYLNLNGLPSTQGMRYLPPMAMALLLALDQGKPWTRRAATVVLVIASFWSIESFLFTLLAWAGYFTINAIRDRSIPAYLMHIALHLGLILAAHLAFVFGVYAWTGRRVDYLPYLDLFLGFLVGRGGFPWPMGVKSEFLWWLPVWFAYFLTLALALLGAVRRAPSGAADRLVALALVGIGALSYFVGRSSETTLGLSFLPFGVLLVSAFDRLAEGRLLSPPRRYAVAGFMAVIFVLVFAFGLERLSRPLDELKGNSTILRRCFSSEGCAPAQVAGRIRAATGMVVDYRYPPVAKLNETPARVADLVGALRMYAPHARRVALLTEFDGESALTWFNGLMAFLYTGQWYSWQTSSPLNDQLSPVLVRRIVASATVRDGEPLIVAKAETKLIKIEQDILSKVRKACRFEKIGETNYFSVFRVEDCHWKATSTM